MKINLNNLDIVSTDDMFLKKHNNIYVSDKEYEILKKYDIDVNKYKNISELIYDIEYLINDSYEELDDLIWVSEKLSEFNYYNNTNK